MGSIHSSLNLDINELFVQEYRNIVTMRQAYLMSASPQPDQFSVLVRGIPKPEEGETYSEKVEKFFIEFHPLHYLSHQMVFHSAELEILLVITSPSQLWQLLVISAFFVAGTQG